MRYAPTPCATLCLRRAAMHFHRGRMRYAPTPCATLRPRRAALSLYDVGAGQCPPGERHRNFQRRVASTTRRARHVSPSTNAIEIQRRVAPTTRRGDMSALARRTAPRPQRIPCIRRMEGCIAIESCACCSVTSRALPLDLHLHILISATDTTPLVCQTSPHSQFGASPTKGAQLQGETR